MEPTSQPSVFPPKDGIIVLDNSTISYYAKCARSFEYYALKRRQPAGERIALKFGSAVHAAMEARYTGKPLNDQIKTALAVLGNELPPDDHRTPEYLAKVLSAYETDRMINDDFEPIIVNGHPFVEKAFALSLGTVQGKDCSYPVVFTGKIDLVIRSQHSGLLRPVDHKTTSIMGKSYFDEFVNSAQPIGYCWAVQELTQSAVDGFHINAIVVRKPTKTGTAYEFHQQPFFVEPERIVEWRENTLWLIQRAVNDWLNNYFPMETEWCVGKYGSCPYLQVCTTQREAREKVIQSNLYQPVTWSPLHN